MQEYRLLLMVKDGIQCIDKGSEYSRYGPHLGLLARNDLPMESFTKIQLY